MSDSSDPTGEQAAVESPLDRLRRLARDSTASKPGPATPGPTDGPVTDAPTVQSLASEPTYDEPGFEAPGYDEPTYAEPSYAEPAAEAPVYNEPTYAEPAFEAPVYDEPAHDEPAYAEPAAGLAEPLPEPEPTSAEPLEVSTPTAPGGSAPLTDAAGDTAADLSEVAAEPSTVEEPEVRPGPPSSARRRRRSAEADKAPAASIVLAVEPSDTPAAAGPEDEHDPRSLKLLAGTLAVLVVLAAVGLFLSVRREHNASQPASDRAAATAAAVKVVSDITTIDYRNLNDWLTRVQADSTDGSNPGKGLRSEYANDKDSLTQVATQQQSVSVGSVVKSAYCGGYCATSQVAGDTASSLVYGSAKVTSKTTPAGAQQLSRFTVKLIKSGGHWLASNVDEAAVAPTS